MKTLPPVAWLGLAGALALVTHRAELRADAVRAEQAAGAASWAEPNAEAVRVAALGFQVAVADGMWVRAVLLFADIFDAKRTEEVAWLGAVLDTVSLLDPSWRSVYFYGGAMMRALGDIEASDRLFLRAVEHLPSDPYFPFSLGMNAYIFRQDAEGAAAWLDRAADLPEAPRWYAAAAAGFLSKDGQRPAALRYLEERIAETEEPALRASLEEKRRRIVHDGWSERLTARLAAGRAADGSLPPLSSLGELPADPLGDAWVLAADGVVRSAVAEREEARAAQRAERSTLTRPWPPGWAPAPGE